MGEREKKSKKPSATKAELLLKEAVFFVDECLGKSLANSLRDAGWNIEWFLDCFTAGTRDEDWIPVVGEKQWVILTKDKNIRRKAWEKDKVIQSRSRMFILSGGRLTGEAMVKRFLDHYLKIGRCLCKHKAPFIAVVGQNSVDVKVAN